MRRRVSLIGVLTLVGATLALHTGTASATGDAPVYSSIPATLPGNVSSLGFEATSTAEFGDVVALGPGPRHLERVRVVLSSWGCEDGTWHGGDCATTPGATFGHPLTLNLYGVGPGGTVGSLIASKTETFDIPYRPSADPVNCTGGRWFDGTTCFNGLAVVATWDFSNEVVSLPSQVAWTVAYDTTHHGANPIGTGASCYSESGGCGYDSLNVGAQTFPGTPFQGGDVDPAGALLSSTWAGAYCDGGIGGTGSLRVDTGCWAGFTPLAEIVTSAPSLEGEWTTNGTQASTYRAHVRPPVNENGTSNFPKARGVIPIQFALSAGTGPFTLYSDLDDTSSDDDFGFVSFTPTTPFTLAELETLQATYDFVDGDCGGGSLRWSIRVDANANGIIDGDPSVFVYYGAPPNFTSCEGADDQSGVNMIARPELRYDLTQLGGPFYGSYDDAIGIGGHLRVLRASLVIDSGWLTRQEMTLSSATVNDASFTAPASSSPAPTCDLPEATLRWSKDDATPQGAVNEGQSIQPGDSGELFRIVDCKYIYNLAVSSLDPDRATRAGTYRVWVNIEGQNVPDPATFDLR